MVADACLPALGAAYTWRQAGIIPLPIRGYGWFHCMQMHVESADA